MVRTRSTATITTNKADKPIKNIKKCMNYVVNLDSLNQESRKRILLYVKEIVSSLVDCDDKPDLEALLEPIYRYEEGESVPNVPLALHLVAKEQKTTTYTSFYCP